MKKVCLIFAALLMLLCVSSCSEPGQVRSYQKEIDEIYVYHSSFGLRYPEYKLDFVNRTFWMYTSDLWSYVERDTSAENEGFVFVSDLDEEKIKRFFIESARYGFTRWEESYVEENIYDGHQWGVVITYADGTQQAVRGSNKYPETWDKMVKEFEDLVGQKIL
jgi:hypothetical protein